MLKSKESREEKKKNQALAYQKEELLKIYLANANLKKELDEECHQHSVQI